MSNDANEDLIEATIRRVTEAKAARAATGHGGDGPPVVSDTGPPGAQQAPPSEGAAPTNQSAHAAPVDEDLIEATIRRVAAAQAANESAPAMVPPADAPPSVEPTPISAAHHAAPANTAADGNWPGELHALRQEVGAMQGMLAELQARVDAALAVSAPGGRAAVATGADDDWDDTPQLPRVPLGQPLRPILRNPAPQSAAAEPLIEVEADSQRVTEQAAIAGPPPARRGFDLLPRTYRVTVEDKRRGVDLVPLHRALLAMDGVRDMSLLSYSNGVAIISIEMVHELDPELLREAVARAMSRGAKVEVHNDTTMVVKLAEE